jgi:hypothetical protein
VNTKNKNKNLNKVYILDILTALEDCEEAVERCVTPAPALSKT